MLLNALTFAEEDILVTVILPPVTMLLRIVCVSEVPKARGEVFVTVPPCIKLEFTLTVPLPLLPVAISASDAEEALIVITPLLTVLVNIFTEPVCDNAFIVTVALVPPILLCE